MRIVDPADGMTLRQDGESGELQVRDPIMFVRYYNNVDATTSSFVEGGWYRTGDIGISKMRLCIKDTVIVHGVSYGIPEFETHLQTVEGVTHSFLTAASYRAPGQDTEGFVVFYSPTFSLDEEDAAAKLFATHRALKDIPVKMITLPPQYIIPIPVDKMEKTTLGKLSRARLVKQFNSLTTLLVRRSYWGLPGVPALLWPFRPNREDPLLASTLVSSTTMSAKCLQTTTSLSSVARPLTSSGTPFDTVEVNHHINLDRRLKREGERLRSDYPRSLPSRSSST